MRCRYCNSEMMPQDNDRMGYDTYSKIYICLNSKCKAVYEEWTTSKGASLVDRNRWFNPKIKDFEK
ncbi:hypothetical protein [Clostridium sporogenes]|uniref:Uncharacterized protein n=1 Tax=Clostridium sporogenes TaxID=1509 RepID=A0AAE6LUT6_CLOSG|nr:hypothetical protein [Clostridium sporogenes]QDY32684.1 hypothetical protein CGS26_10075 [Clostridium sporogenes]